jgi:hypothetical protein
MAKPAMVQTIQRILNKKEQAMVADQQAQQTVAVATQTSGMPAPPSAQVMQGIYQQQQHQAMMQEGVAKNLQNILAQKYYKPADALRAQREQLAMQEAQIKEQIKAKQKEQEYAMIAPREIIQNSESANYITPDQLAIWEQIYAGLSPKKKFNLAKLSPMIQYSATMQDYPGGFADVNYDKQMRPLGKDTNRLTEF